MNENIPSGILIFVWLIVLVLVNMYEKIWMVGNRRSTLS